jgi:DNA-binding NtrC family response regulator
MKQSRKITASLATVETYENRVDLTRFRNQAKRLEPLLERLSAALEELGSTKEALGLAAFRSVEFGIDFYEEVRSFEIALIRRALQVCESQAEAAALLKLPPTTLNSILQRYKLARRLGRVKRTSFRRKLVGA